MQSTSKQNRKLQTAAPASRLVASRWLRLNRCRILFPVAVVFIAGCLEPESDSHRVVINGETMLVGEISQEELYRENPQFARDAKGYIPDPGAISSLKEFTARTKIVVFLGTWCSDSQSEIPKFLKVIEEAGNPNFEVTVYGLDRTKQDETGDATAHGISFVPTIVLYRGDKELGRIVEYPKTSMEADLLKILRARLN